MERDEHVEQGHPVGGCCPCGGESTGHGFSRRTFLGGLSTVALAGCGLRAMAPSAATSVRKPPARTTLTVKPILTYQTYRPRKQWSWRNWGGVATEQDAKQEVARIEGELKALRKTADFPVKCLPVTAVSSPGQIAGLGDLKGADAVVLYAAAGGSGIFDAVRKLNKDVVFFMRHRSGPVYLWYEIIHPRYLRAHSDQLTQTGVDYQDVVVDSQDELLWRLRALCGLKNARGTRIIAVGGPGGWSHGGAKAPQHARDRFGFDIQTLAYKDLGKLIQAARADAPTMKLARQRADIYLADRKVSLETDKKYVEGCFLLDHVFRDVMAKADARAITVNACMGTIMPMAQTTACLTLTTLNDDGYMAFCESDFVAIPAGVLLSCISGRPPFLHNPTYPHDGMITLAHCTAPRRMDGKSLEPVRIVTHYESDFGAAPKVEFRKGQKLTIVNADFAAERWLGLSGEVIDSPFLPICRSQLNCRLNAPDQRVAEEMRGFHWMMVYGDYLRETGYAVKKTGIQWECLG